MLVEFRHGPKDGEKKFLPIGRSSETIIVEVNGHDYLYRETERHTPDGHTVYQCVGLLAAAA